jgi:hypothetical protein
VLGRQRRRRSRVDAVIREFIAAGVAQHVSVRLDAEIGLDVAFFGQGAADQWTLPLMGWSGRAPAPPAIEAGNGRQRRGARHVSESHQLGHSNRP